MPAQDLRSQFRDGLQHSELRPNIFCRHMAESDKYLIPLELWDNMSWESISMYISIFPSVLWHCWLGGRKGIRPASAEKWLNLCLPSCWLAARLLCLYERTFQCCQRQWMHVRLAKPLLFLSLWLSYLHCPHNSRGHGNGRVLQHEVTVAMTNTRTSVFGEKKTICASGRFHCDASTAW